MKYVVVTTPNADGVSEVFHTMTLPEGQAQPDLIDRWNSIVESSPINVITVSSKENIATGSIYDPSTGEFSMAEGADPLSARPADKTLHVFLINNVVASSFSSAVIANVPNPKYVAAFADPISVFGLEDESDVTLGYTYNGTTFSPPSYI
jgi:hypothetical protein